ncbi:MAG: FKBP-type peptidyl-prolyl cis-trans isomerase [Flavitalea sp.]
MKLIRSVIIFCAIVICGMSCIKNKSSDCQYTITNNVAPAGEQSVLQTYLDTNNIVAVKHPNGFYYSIQTAGTKTDSIGVCSQIQISYTGKFVNGVTFDSNSGVWLPLGKLIDGWKYGIPLIGKGGRIKLYIPPSLGYGSADIKDQTSGKVVIPANSILIFDISMSDYTKQN